MVDRAQPQNEIVERVEPQDEIINPVAVEENDLLKDELARIKQARIQQAENIERKKVRKENEEKEKQIRLEAEEAKQNEIKILQAQINAENKEMAIEFILAELDILDSKRLNNDKVLEYLTQNKQEIGWAFTQNQPVDCINLKPNLESWFKNEGGLWCLGQSQNPNNFLQREQNPKGLQLFGLGVRILEESQSIQIGYFNVDGYLEGPKVLVTLLGIEKYDKDGNRHEYQSQSINNQIWEAITPDRVQYFATGLVILSVLNLLR